MQKTFVALFALALSTQVHAAPETSSQTAATPATGSAWLAQQNEVTGGTNASIGGNTAYGTASAGFDIGYHRAVLRNLQVGGSADFNIRFGDQDLRTSSALYAQVSGNFGGDTIGNDFFVRAGPGVNLFTTESSRSELLVGGTLRVGKRFQLSPTTSFSPYALVALWSDGEFVWNITPLSISFLF